MSGDQKKIPPVKCVWGLLCSLSSVDQERNNISLFNVIDELNLPKELFSPTGKIPLEHEIITLWRRDINTSIDNRELTIDVEIAFIDPNGGVVQQFIATIKFNQNARRMRFRIRVDGFHHIITPGDYVYRISIVPSDGSDPILMLPIPLEVKERLS